MIDIDREIEDIDRCNRCGFCQTACPVFRSTGHESGVARGRLSLLRAIREKRLTWSKELEDPLFDCLLCGACTANCFPAIPTADLIVKSRETYLQRVERKPIHHLLFDTLLPYPNRLRWAARSVAAGKKTGLSDVAQALGLLRLFGQEAVFTDSVLARLTEPPFRDTVPPGEYAGSGADLHIGFFVGCGGDILNQTASKATFQILKKIGRRVTVLDSSCCGLPAYVYGDLTAARKMAKRNFDVLERSAFDVIVADCASCASFIKRYPRLFSDNPEQRARADRIAGQTRDFVEMAAAAMAGDGNGEDMLATYHDPCHASRGQNIAEEPRDILTALPGIRYVEMPEADWCCGGAGAYALSHQRLSRQVLDRKIENFKSTGADLLVTACPSCIIHLTVGMRRHGLDGKVCHISELIARHPPSGGL